MTRAKLSPAQVISNKREDIQLTFDTLINQTELEFSKIRSRFRDISVGENGTISQGPSGRAGDKGDKGDVGNTGPSGVAVSVEVSFQAGENITATNAVYLADDNKVYNANSNTVFHAPLIIGVSKQSVIINDFPLILMLGPITDANFTFTIGTPLFLNGVGSLSTTPPTSGFSMLMGHQGSGNTFMMNKQVPLLF